MLKQYKRAREALATALAELYKEEQKVRSKEVSLLLMYRADGLGLEESRAKARRDLSGEYMKVAKLKGEVEKRRAEVDVLEWGLKYDGAK